MSYKDFIKQAVSNEHESIENKQTNDWDIDTTIEHIRPGYNDNNRDYSISVKDMITSINKSKYKLSGTNVWLPDKNGVLVPLNKWINGQSGSGGNGSNVVTHYRIEMVSSNGNIIKDKQFNTTLKAILYEDNEDVTDIKGAKYFKWARFSGSTERDKIADAEWNLKWANGAKEIPITHEDVNRNAMFQVQFVTEKEADIWEKEAYKAYMNKIKNAK